MFYNLLINICLMSSTTPLFTTHEPVPNGTIDSPIYFTYNQVTVFLATKMIT